MATKDDCLSFKKRQIGFVDSGDQYSNLNLNNQNHDCVFEEIFRPKILHLITKKSQNYDLSHSKDLRSVTNSWNKFNKRSPTTFLNPSNDFEARNEFKKAKSANNSTLSLHIAAYENSTEVAANSYNRERADERKWKNPKPSFTRSKDVIENLFEFPRQHENEKTKTPEVAQFKASQKLLNPNKSIPFIMSTSQAPTTERFHVLAQLEHLQSRYTGCGHADSNRWDWLTNQHRDTSTSLIGHPDHLSYMAVAKNYSRERARIELLDKMVSPCGPPPKRTPLDDI